MPFWHRLIVVGVVLLIAVAIARLIDRRIARRQLSPETVTRYRVVRRSVEYAFAHREASLPFVRAHAQEMSEQVMYQHIDLYVNEFTRDLGEAGYAAVEALLSRAAAEGLVPRLAGPLR